MVLQNQSKIRGMLATDTYQKVNDNPTARVTRKTSILINDKDCPIPPATKKCLCPSNPLPPKFYGLPKRHKPGTPLRPTAKFSPIYNLSKLASTLKPQTGTTSSYIKDSAQFNEELAKIKLQPDDLMVSFDVESLYTNVPLKGALEVIDKRLAYNDMPTWYTKLIEHSLCQNYFIWQEELYIQLDGVAMGSPVAPVMANIFMEDFEEKALATVDNPR